jgi:hypothetical protein
MSGLVVKAIGLFAWTRLLGAIGRRAGPGRVGLLLGLPSTTAAALWACGRENGSSAAVVMADAGLLGLAAAVALPAAYARAAGRGHRMGRALAVALACYAAAAAAVGLGGLPEVGTIGRVAIAAAAIVIADRRGRQGSGAVEARAGGRSRRLALSRALAPAACLMVVTALRDAAGAGWAGLLVPFPAATTALLVAAHAEAGPAAARRVAAGVPRGSLGTLAFLVAFRSTAPALGPTWAAAWGVAAAVVALAAVEAVTRGPSASRRDRRSRGIARNVAAAGGRTNPVAPGLSSGGPWSRPRMASSRSRVVRRPTRSPPSPPSTAPGGRGFGPRREKSAPRRGPPGGTTYPGRPPRCTVSASIRPGPAVRAGPGIRTVRRQGRGERRC